MAFSFLSRLLIPVALAACPEHTVCLGSGTITTVPGILSTVVDLLLYWSSFIAVALFIIGGIMMIMSGGSDALLSSGKKIMKGSLIGFALVLASWMILSTVLYFITF